MKLTIARMPPPLNIVRIIGYISGRRIGPIATRIKDYDQIPMADFIEGAVRGWGLTLEERAAFAQEFIRADNLSKRHPYKARVEQREIDVSLAGLEEARTARHPELR